MDDERGATDEAWMVEALMDFLGDAAWDDDEAELYRATVKTFADAMLLTHDQGVVVRLRNGAEFQITVKQSREAGQ